MFSALYIRSSRPSVKLLPVSQAAVSSKRRLARAVATFVLTLVLASNAFGWGQEGHRVVATIAERHLTAKARERVRQILGPEGSLATVATWADEIRPSRSETAPWHYIDIPLNASAIDPARDCPKGDCVTAAITRFVDVLRDTVSSPDAKNEALKFVVHFVAEAQSGALLEPWFPSRTVASEIIRRQAVFHRRKFALYFEKWGCLVCETKKKPHQSHGMCHTCHHRFVERLSQIEKDYAKAHPHEYENQQIDNLTSRIRSAERILGTARTLPAVPAEGEE